MPGQKRFALTFSSLFLLGALLMLSLAACGTGGGAGGSNGNNGAASSANGNIATPTASTNTPTLTASTTPVPLAVTSVDMAVSPHSISSYACGTNVTVTYTATFHFPANNTGGPVAFQYTTDNGRGDTPASLTVQPGQTTVPYQFTWSGALPDDHTMPEPGGVIVTSPSSLNSQLLGPSGSCSAASTAAFMVTAATVTANTSVNGHTCGSQFTETYVALFSFAPNSPGGTLVFTYTTDNGRSNSQPISLQIAANQTSLKYKFYWKGTLPADNTEPGVGIVMVTAPNQIISSIGAPTGQCTPM